MVKHIHVPIPNQRSESATSHVIKEGAVRTALTLVWADGGYNARQVERAAPERPVHVEIVKRPGNEVPATIAKRR